MRRTVLLAVLVVAAARLASGQVITDKPAGGDARAAIEANHMKFIGAINKGDAAAVAALHAADARLLPQDDGPVEGAQNVLTFWQGLMKIKARLVQLETLRVESGGDLAYEVGSYLLTTQPRPGQTDIHSGMYVAVWRREGEEWKVAAAIWNTGDPERASAHAGTPPGGCTPRGAHTPAGLLSSAARARR